MNADPHETRSGHERKAAGSRLLSMGTAYALGTFNDNFFKQAALLMAATEGLTSVQGVATLLFALPFALCSAWAGWLADRFPKKKLVVGSKFMELAAMMLGVWALCAIHWTGIIFVVFLMGLQSTFFSPALNGSIPENFFPSEVPKVNALLKLATTATILLGIALAGLIMDLPGPDFAAQLPPQGKYGFGRLTVTLLAVLVSVIGIAAAFGIGRSNTVGAENPFPWLGPLDSVRHALECRKNDPALFLALAGEAFFYFISSFVVLCINNLGVRQLGFSLSATSMLSVALMVGICIGSLAAGRHEASVWRRLMIPAGAGMAAGLLVSAIAPFLPGQDQRFIFLAAAFTLTGMAGGLYLIPLVSQIQLRPKATEKGKVLGISNFASFSGIIISGFIFGVSGDAPPALLLAASGLAGMAFIIWAARQPGREEKATLADQASGPLGSGLKLIIALRYRVKIKGLENIAPMTPDRPILFMPNHPALIDPVIIFSLLSGLKPRPLVDSRQMSGALGRLAARVTGAVLIPDMRLDGAAARQGVEQGLKAISSALASGKNVLLYPAGKIYRSPKESLGGNSGAATIVQANPNIRIVLARTSGLWGSSFSRASGPPNFAGALLKGLAALAANAFFFTPRREVTVEFHEPDNPPPANDKKNFNAWLENFYNQAEQPAKGVPLYFWRGNKALPLPAPGQIKEDQPHSKPTSPNAPPVSQELREAVYNAIRKAAVLPPDHPLDDSTSLGADLGLDSLTLMELGLSLEEKYGHSIDNLENLVTVGDCLVLISEAEEAAGKAANPAWFAAPNSKKLAVPQGADNIPAAFVHLAGQAPKAAAIADRNNLRSRRDILTGALVLAHRFKKLPDARIGIMLPATPAAPVVWLAAMLAGKEAAFFNWTGGPANLAHCAALAGIKQIISASALLDRLERQGLDLASTPISWLRLEDLAASLTPPEKIRGFMRALLMRGVKHYEIKETAAILFTSGSEAMPKAVPLSHANLLANAGDIISSLGLGPSETVLAMLPPFHSFGLMVGLVLPLALGLKAAFHPNPTETGRLISLVRDFKLTLLAAPPTFLRAMLERARGTNHLSSLRYAFAGAEKCPEPAYREFAAQCPRASLCEGYGITECSPVISVNRPGKVQIGSIGHLLPSVSAALTLENDGKITGRAAIGQTGMLLVRGPSIFNGYLGEQASPFVEFEGKTWYRTGDLLSMDETGRLFFQGRLKRFVKLGGEMISLPQLENILQEAFGKQKQAEDPEKDQEKAKNQEGPLLAVEAVNDEHPEIILFATLPLSAAQANAALRSAGMPPLYAIRRVRRLESIPLLGSGKTDYRALKKLA